MKLGLFTILFLFLIVPLAGLAQNDTLIINNNYKFKIGVKGLVERTRYMSLNKAIFNFGVQGIYKLGTTKSSIETGGYYYTRNAEGMFIDSVYSLPPFNRYTVVVSYRNIQVPIKYRFDTKIIYFTIGFYGEYFLQIDATSRVKRQAELNNSRKNFYLGYTGSMGFEKAIFNEFSLFFEASFSTHLFTEDIFIPSNVGIAFGVNYKILKH